MVRNRLFREAQRVRHGFSHADSGCFTLGSGEKNWTLELTEEQLQAVFGSLLERLKVPILRALRDARIQSSGLDEVLLVGGATRIPLVRKLVARLFGRFPDTRLNPDEVIVQGAVVQAALKARDAALEEVVLTDVCPYSLGVETVIELGRHVEDGHYLPIIERNTTVPVSRVQTVYTMADNQRQVVLRVFQGESRLVRDNILLGELSIQVPPRPRGEVSLDIRFTYDINGLLEMDVMVPLTGDRHNLVIENNPGILSPQEIADRLQALQALKIHPRDQQVNTVLLARLERLYQEVLGERRQYVDELAARFNRALETQDEHLIREVRKGIMEQMEMLESDL